MYSSSIRCPSPPEHWSVFCFAATSLSTISAGPAAQPRRTPGALFYPDGRGGENVRLAFSMVDESLIDEGVERLASLLA
jgi:DNA-binding transcriptional MocR family regulator